MTHRSHPAPQCPGAGPINAAGPAMSEVRWAVNGRKRVQTAPSDYAAKGSATDMTHAAAVPVLDRRDGKTQSP